MCNGAQRHDMSASEASTCRIGEKEKKRYAVREIKISRLKARGIAFHGNANFATVTLQAPGDNVLVRQ